MVNYTVLGWDSQSHQLLKSVYWTCNDLKRGFTCESDNHTPVLVVVPKVHEYDAVATLLRVCGNDTKTTNKQKETNNILNLIFLAHFMVI